MKKSTTQIYFLTFLHPPKNLPMFKNSKNASNYY
jgi:hypothetical protein